MISRFLISFDVPFGGCSSRSWPPQYQTTRDFHCTRPPLPPSPSLSPSLSSCINQLDPLAVVAKKAMHYEKMYVFLSLSLSPSSRGHRAPKSQPKHYLPPRSARARARARPHHFPGFHRETPATFTYVHHRNNTAPSSPTPSVRPSVHSASDELLSLSLSLSFRGGRHARSAL